MPITVVMKNRIVDSQQDFVDILETLNESLKSRGMGISDSGIYEIDALPSSEMAVTSRYSHESFWAKYILVKIEKIAGKELGSHFCSLQTLRVELDPPASFLRDGYIDYLNEIAIEDGLKSRDTENEKITSRRVLVREILIRFVTLALCKDMKADKDGHALLEAMRIFINEVKKKDKLNKGFWGGHKPSMLARALGSEHDDWLNILVNMVSSIKILNANTKAISETLNFIGRVKRKAMSFIIAQIDNRREPDDLAENWIRKTLSLCEDNLLNKQKKVSDSQQKMSVVFYDNIQCLSKVKLDDRQQKVITVLRKQGDNSEKNKNDKIAACYKLLNWAEQLFMVVSQIDLLVSMTGWILIMMGVLKLDKIGKLIDELEDACKKICVIDRHDSIFDTKIGKGVIKYGIGTGASLANMGQMVSKQLADLMKEDYRKKLGKWIEKATGNLAELQNSINYDLIDETKLKLYLVKGNLTGCAHDMRSSFFKGKNQFTNTYISSLPVIEGLKHVRVSGDGHCLYHAVCLYTGQDQQTLRNTIAENLENNIVAYRRFIALPSNKTVEDYIHDIRLGVEWASHIEIEILMNLLDRPILVVGPSIKLINEIDKVRFSGEPIFVYYNGHNHYDGLVLDKNYKHKVGEILSQLSLNNRKSAQGSTPEQNLNQSKKENISWVSTNLDKNFTGARISHCEHTQLSADLLSCKKASPTTTVTSNPSSASLLKKAELQQHEIKIMNNALTKVKELYNAKAYEEISEVLDPHRKLIKLNRTNNISQKLAFYYSCGLLAKGNFQNALSEIDEILKCTVSERLSRKLRFLKARTLEALNFDKDALLVINELCSERPSRQVYKAFRDEIFEKFNAKFERDKRKLSLG